MKQLRIDVRDLRLVQAISLQGTTAAAARVLGMTQSGVSHQLRSLEERLGILVFDRRGRNLTLNEAGGKMVGAGKDILEAVRALETDLLRSAEAGLTLRVATQCSTAYSWLPQATVEMRERGAALRIRPVGVRDNELTEALLDGEVDLALYLDAPKDARLCQRRLFDDELVLLVERGHPLAGRGWVTGEDLTDEDLLMLDAAKENGRRVGKVLFPRGGGFRSVNYLPLPEAIVEMVKAGFGVSILPSWSVGPSLSRGDIVGLRLNKSGMKRRWAGAYRRDTQKAAPIRELLSILRARGIPKLPGFEVRGEAAPYG